MAQPAGLSADVTPDVLITPDAYKAVVDACRDAHPAEVCGLIAAHYGTLDQAYPVPNVAQAAPGRCGFRMDPGAQFRAMRHIDGTGGELGGIYHSHPHTPAVPSDADIALAAYPEAVHLIVGLREPARPEVLVWRIADGSAQELTLRIAPDHPQEPR